MDKEYWFISGKVFIEGKLVGQKSGIQEFNAVITMHPIQWLIEQKSTVLIGFWAPITKEIHDQYVESQKQKQRSNVLI